MLQLNITIVKLYPLETTNNGILKRTVRGYWENRNGKIAASNITFFGPRTERLEGLKKEDKVIIDFEICSTESGIWLKGLDLYRTRQSVRVYADNDDII